MKSTLEKNLEYKKFDDKKICKNCKYFIDDSDKIGCSKIYIDLEAINREYGIDKFGCSFFSPKF